MELKQEADIRQYIETWLKQQGISFEREVVCGNGVRADLVTPDMVIEIKKYLNRGAMYQAHGQGVAYQKLLNKPKLLIIGLAPPSESRYQEAQRIAENIRSETVQVVFLDKDPRWELAVASAQSPASSSKSASKPPVLLPFEPVPASASESAKSAKSAASKSSKASEPTAQEQPSGSGMKDFWVLLLLILFFLWIRAAIWRNQPTEVPTMQPSPEVVP
ncbi:hypothetical protein HJG54_08210 [Leptolyngbya sp. NK1-12]|uniref:Uncharacterized protein n=1 Tax=Leptolyngbya sp. NK1-12 TaxID=2547451 RepID=A0AA96WK63_9CYAN|nr:hypothetical protein [Leptolyngbya sp. NK1-12]WNZ22841.1 hypothetical protein HJG54_08210 [Leptolyngbya sp. NK1-12]